MKLKLSPALNLKLILLLVVFVAVPAQAASECAECADQSASAEGCDLSDMECLCPTFPKFQQAAQNCLQTNCAEARELQLGQTMVQVVQIGCHDVVSLHFALAFSTTCGDWIIRPFDYYFFERHILYWHYKLHK
ncbi:hypothetical protein V8D89_001393 [Ganoderma adspersum]